MMGCPRWQSTWSPAGIGDREGAVQDEAGSGLANFLRMPCRREGAVSVLGLGLAPVCFFRWAGDGNPRDI